MDNSNAQELILWVIGRMDRLKRLGMIKGGSSELTEAGAAQYRELNEALAPPAGHGARGFDYLFRSAREQRPGCNSEASCRN